MYNAYELAILKGDVPYSAISTLINLILGYVPEDAIRNTRKLDYVTLMTTSIN